MARSLELDLSALKPLKGRQAPLLAFDFGTAFSKVAVILDRKGGEELPLPVGRIAARGQSRQLQNPYILASTIFVKDGVMLFGPRAYEEGIRAGEGRARFESPKSLFNSDDLEAAAGRTLGADVVPGDIGFTALELAQLYLAYLTAIASEALEERGQPRHIERRYAVPGWTPERARGYARAISTLLANAQILADTLRDRWHDGLPLALAREALDALADMDADPPRHLVAEGLAEATAAGNSIFNPRWRKPKLFVVVDVGAGTVDMAGFLVFKHRIITLTGFRVAQLEGTARGYELAGNALDEAFVALALVKAGIAPGDPEHAKASRALARQKRELKESLFQPPYEVEVAVSRDEVVTVSRDELLASPAVVALAEGLRQEYRKVVEAIGAGPFERYGHELNVHLTGGGSRLPFVESLVDEAFEIGGRKLRIIAQSGPPDWVEAADVDWLRDYPQLAVAIGAARPTVPEGAGPYTPEGLHPVAPGRRRLARDPKD
ncbi:MAG: hypothetical protein R3D33_00950 [Hyphomicrobiaceae bacterium]